MKIVGCIKRVVRRSIKYIFKKYESYRIKKVIQFELTIACNYHCEYCLQNDYRDWLKKENKLNASDDVIDGFIKFISNYKKRCEVRLLGGEIFMHKRLFEVAEAVLSNGHDVDITTNFSFPIEMYKRILSYRKKGARVHVAISLHLSQISDIEEFKIKLDKLFALKKGDSRFTIGMQAVLTEENFDALKEFDAYVQQKYNNPLTFQAYKEKWDDDGMEYSNKVKEYLTQNAICDAEFTRKSCEEFDSIYGTVCRAGEKYCLVRTDGVILRCNGSQVQGALGVIGHMSEGNINFHKKPMPCLSQKCGCPLYLQLGLVKLGHKNITEIQQCEKIYLGKTL